MDERLKQLYGDLCIALDSAEAAKARFFEYLFSHYDIDSLEYSDDYFDDSYDCVYGVDYSILMDVLSSANKIN